VPDAVGYIAGAARGTGLDAISVVARARNHRNRLASPLRWMSSLSRSGPDLDVLACPRCGGRLRLIDTVENPAVVGKILAHLSLLHPADSPGPAPPSADLRVAAPSH